MLKISFFLNLLANLFLLYRLYRLYKKPGNPNRDIDMIASSCLLPVGLGLLVVLGVLLFGVN